jgi:hypothetical protein
MAHVVAPGEPKLAFACIDGTAAQDRLLQVAQSADDREAQIG